MAVQYMSAATTNAKARENLLNRRVRKSDEGKMGRAMMRTGIEVGK
jgi:hypothetical protein